MNFLNLEYFVAVAEEGNITHAAEKLYISQQSMSNHIQKLEKSLDVKLFNRSPAFSLTFAGQRLLNTANQILNLRRQIIMEIDDINNRKRGEVRIGISHTRGRYFLPKILPEFCRTHPLIEVKITEGNSQLLEDWLHHGRLDLLIGFAPVLLAEAETRDILKERLMLVVPTRMLAEMFPDDRREVTARFQEDCDMKAFAKCPYLMMSTGNRTRTLFDRYISDLGLHLDILMEMESIETLFSLACEGMGITVYPEMFVKSLDQFYLTDERSPVRFFPLNDPSTIGNLVVAYHSEHYLSESAKDFIEACFTIRNFFENGWVRPQRQ